MIIEICSNIDINVGETDIEVSYGLPIRQSLGNRCEKLVLKFVNYKHGILILSKKFMFSSADLKKLNISTKLYDNMSTCSCKLQC